MKQITAALRFWNLLEAGSGNSKINLTNLLVYLAIILGIYAIIAHPPVEIVCMISGLISIATANLAYHRYDTRKQAEVKSINDMVNTTVGDKITQLQNDLTDVLDRRMLGLQTEIKSVKSTAELAAKTVGGNRGTKVL